jgi:hypothetical protein
MNLQQAADHLRFALKANVPVFLWGAPGIGKTDTGESVAADLGLPCLTETLSTMESVDLRGLPRDRNGVVEWSVPDFIARLRALGEDSVLFVDEANANAQSVQVPLMQLALKRRIGPHELPRGCRVIMAGNRQSDRAAAQRMPTALANRLLHLDVEPDLKAWLKWAAANAIHPMVCAFLMLRGEGTVNKPGLLFQFDPAKPDVRAFPSPRSWAAVSKIADAPDSLRFGLVAGLVGEGAAGEFNGFVDIYRTLPPLPQIIGAPDTAPVPSEPSIQYAVAIALSRAANAANFAAVLRYMARVGREFQIVTATDAVRRQPALASTPAFIHWAAANADVAI